MSALKHSRQKGAITVAGKKRHSGRPPKYDWDDWLSRTRFTVKKGTDYNCSVISMAQQIRNAAHQRGLRVAIIEGSPADTMYVRVMPNDNPRRRDDEYADDVEVPFAVEA